MNCEDITESLYRWLQKTLECIWDGISEASIKNYLDIYHPDHEEASNYIDALLRKNLISKKGKKYVIPKKAGSSTKTNKSNSVAKPSVDAAVLQHRDAGSHQAITVIEHIDEAYFYCPGFDPQPFDNSIQATCKICHSKFETEKYCADDDS